MGGGRGDVCYGVRSPPPLALTACRPPSLITLIALPHRARIHSGDGVGALVDGAKGRFERCEIAGNASHGVGVKNGGDPTLVGCTIRDHAAVGSSGVYVEASACGKAKIGAGCVFLRNATADVFRQREAMKSPGDA